MNKYQDLCPEEIGIVNRFRGYLPVVVDVETGGFESTTDALLEVAASPILMDDDGQVYPDKIIEFFVKPFEGANVEQSAIDFIGYDPFHPLRIDTIAKDALAGVFKKVRHVLSDERCKRAILVGHNAAFDLKFLMAAAERNGIKKNPFHPFSCFDTATLSGLACGQTVLAVACERVGIKFDQKQAHSAKYDVSKTAELFCYIVNLWQKLGGWKTPYCDM